MFLWQVAADFLGHVRAEPSWNRREPSAERSRKFPNRPRTKYLGYDLLSKERDRSRSFASWKGALHRGGGASRTLASTLCLLVSTERSNSQSPRLTKSRGNLEILALEDLAETDFVEG